MPRSDDTYGFNREDADQLLASLVGRERIVPIPRFSAGAQFTIQVQNNTGWGTLAKYDPITLGDPLSTISATSSIADIVWDGIAVDNRKPIAILQEQAVLGATVPALIYGHTIGHIFAPNSSYQSWVFAEINPSEGSLRPSPVGQVRMCETPAAGTDDYLLCFIGQHRGSAIIKATDGIPGSSGGYMGYADCGIYGPKYSDGDITYSVWAERVFNLSSTAVPSNTYLIATRVNDCLCVDYTPF